MSLESLQIRDFSDRLSKYTEYLVDQGVDLTKVRFSDKPNITYDYEQNLVVSSSFLFYDGNVIKTDKTIIINCELYDVTNVNLAETINNTNLGIVIYVDQMVKKYIKGEWVLQFQMAFLDEKMDILNDYDDIWNLNDIESLETKIESIKLYFEENINDLNFITINPSMLTFIESQVGFDEHERTFAGLPMKINGNMKEDIISLSTYDESFYLKITNE